MTQPPSYSGDANFDLSADGRAPKKKYDPEIDPSDGYEAIRFAETAVEEKRWREWLERERHVVMHGAEGAGKTARRIRLQSTCYSYAGLGSFPAFYYLPTALMSASDWQYHCRSIAQSIANELFAFFCERGGFGDLPFKRQMYVLDLLRLDYRVPLGADCLCAPIPSQRVLDVDFRYADRSSNPKATIRYREIKEKLNALDRSSVPNAPGAILEVARNALVSAGFNRAYLFIDNLDRPLRIWRDSRPAPAAFCDVLRPVFEHVKDLGENHMFVKAFLPTEIVEAGLLHYLESDCLVEKLVDSAKPLVLCLIRTSIGRKTYIQLKGSSMFVGRTEIVSGILKTISTAQKAASEILAGHFGAPTPRFIVLKAGAGVGKTVLLQELLDTLPDLLKVASDGELSARITQIFNMKAILDDTSGEGLRNVMAECAGAELAGATLAEMTFSMQSKLRSPNKAGQMVVVLVDDLETLNNPLVEPTDLDRSARVSDVKNHLLSPLLQLAEVPVVIIAAARSMSNEPLTYLTGSGFQDALKTIDVVNRPEDIQKVLGVEGTAAALEVVAECAGSLLVANWRSTYRIDQGLERALIDEMLAREPAAQRVWFERLLTALSKSASDIHPTDIKTAAEALGLPAVLQNRIVARLLASGHLENTGWSGYRVYPPLANLLRQLPNA